MFVFKIIDTDQYPDNYSYEVQLQIEIDQTLYDNKGGEAGVIAYIDMLIAGANIVFENEIDTHLSVVHIQLTNIYDNAASPAAAITIQRNFYNYGDWSRDVDSGTEIDLHHALIGREIGGGLAYFDVICNEGWGFGIR